jgi:hypothetical protein
VVLEIPRKLFTLLQSTTPATCAAPRCPCLKQIPGGAALFLAQFATDTLRRNSPVATSMLWRALSNSLQYHPKGLQLSFLHSDMA